jgi:hypothetical protein
MAALFDALMFLSVMSVVSVVVLVAFFPGQNVDDDTQTYLQKSHSVLLGTTLRSWSSSSERFMPVSDAIVTLMFLNKPLPERIHAEVELLLDGLFQPQFVAEWRCTLGNLTYVFGTDLSTGPGSGNVFASTLEVASPSGPCTFMLTVHSS